MGTYAIFVGGTNTVRGPASGGHQHQKFSQPIDRLWIMVAIENELLAPISRIQNYASFRFLPPGGTAMIRESGSTPVRMEPLRQQPPARANTLRFR